MSPWLKVYDDLPRHPKTTRLSVALDINRAQAVGHLVCLWAWAAIYAPDGQLRRYNDVEVAEGAGWHGDPKVFVKRLKSAGWLTGARSINDWDEHSGTFFRERERWHRRQKSLQNPTNDAEYTRSTRGASARRGEESRKDKSIVPSATSLLTPDFVTWWEAYGKVGSRADAAVLYAFWRKQGAQAEDLLIAATNYRASCLARASFQAHARTFLAKTPNRWDEWVRPEAKPNGNGKQHVCPECEADLAADGDGSGGLHCPVCDYVRRSA